MRGVPTFCADPAAAGAGRRLEADAKIAGQIDTFSGWPID